MDGTRENDHLNDKPAQESSNSKAVPAPDFIEVIRFAKLAMKRFYENPNYAIYSTPQPPQHEQIRIVFGDRAACVDRGISEVIQCLWQLDLDTLGSCEFRPSGRAYVNLPVPLHADKLHKILLEHGIEAELKSKTRSLVDPNTQRSIPIVGGDVLFRSTDIPAVVAALRQHIVRSHIVAAAFGVEIVSPNNSWSEQLTTELHHEHK